MKSKFKWLLYIFHKNTAPSVESFRQNVSNKQKQVAILKYIAP